MAEVRRKRKSPRLESEPGAVSISTMRPRIPDLGSINTETENTGHSEAANTDDDRNQAEQLVNSNAQPEEDGGNTPGRVFNENNSQLEHSSKKSALKREVRALSSAIAEVCTEIRELKNIVLNMNTTSQDRGGNPGYTHLTRCQTRDELLNLAETIDTMTDAEREGTARQISKCLGPLTRIATRDLMKRLAVEEVYSTFNLKGQKRGASGNKTALPMAVQNFILEVACLKQFPLREARAAMGDYLKQAGRKAEKEEDALALHTVILPPAPVVLHPQATVETS